MGLTKCKIFELIYLRKERDERGKIIKVEYKYMSN